VTGARLYDVEVTHVRAEPVRHEVRHHGYQWFVDIDDLPRLPRQRIAQIRQCTGGRRNGEESRHR